jgi:hypothetical protein
MKIMYADAVNLLCSTTPSKLLLSSGSGFTLHICEIYYLPAVNNDSATSESNFHQGQCYSGPAGGGPKANFLAFLFYQGHYLPYGLTPQYQLRSLITQGAED